MKLLKDNKIQNAIATGRPRFLFSYIIKRYHHSNAVYTYTICVGWLVKIIGKDHFFSFEVCNLKSSEQTEMEDFSCTITPLNKCLYNSIVKSFILCTAPPFH